MAFRKPNYSELDLAQLAAYWNRGDLYAFTEINKWLKNLVYLIIWGVLLKKIGDSATLDDLDDASQDTWMRVVKCMGRLPDEDSRHTRNWILRAAKICAIDYAKGRIKIFSNEISYENKIQTSEGDDVPMISILVNPKSHTPLEHLIYQEDYEAYQKFLRSQRVPNEAKIIIKIEVEENIGYVNASKQIGISRNRGYRLHTLGKQLLEMFIRNKLTDMF